MRGVLALLLGAMLATAVHADESITADGKRLTGKLEQDEKGRLRFRVTGLPTPLPLADFQHVRLTPSTPPRRPASYHRIALPDGQQLTGEVLDLGEKELKLRTPWAEQVVVPRPAVLAVLHPPGQMIVLDEDFENEPKSWKLTGGPMQSERQRTSGKLSLLLNAPGQTAEYLLPEALTAGRLSLQFHDPGVAAGARWLVEAEFQRQQGPWTARVVVASDGTDYAVEATGGESKSVARTKGWHQLDLRFDNDYLLVGVDDRPLWESGKEGPGGPLRRIRLSCVSPKAGAKGEGEVFFDDLLLFRAVADRPHQRLDVTRDEVWRSDGDQLSGHLGRVGRSGVELHGRSGPQTLSWSQVRGVFPNRQPVPLRTTEGEHVRVWLHAPVEGGPDSLEGTLTALDERRLLLKHPLLGELAIERVWLREVRRLFHGRRVELDNGFHHLGDPNRVVPEVQPARAEGPALRRTFRLEAVPAEARLLIHVVHLKGPGDGVGPALERGEQRTEVIVNGQRVDYLNRHVGRSSPEPTAIRLTVPRRCLQAGENVLELRQTPDLVTERCASCGIVGVALELAR